MRKIFIILSVALVGCYPEHPVIDSSGQKYHGRDIVVFTYDSCEYVMFPSDDTRGNWGTHKGNCKFCAERNGCE